LHSPSGVPLSRQARSPLGAPRGGDSIALRTARARTHLHGVESSGGSRVGMYHGMRPSKQNLALAGVTIKITNGGTRHRGFGIGTPEDLRQRNQSSEGFPLAWPSRPLSAFDHQTQGTDVPAGSDSCADEAGTARCGRPLSCWTHGASADRVGETTRPQIVGYIPFGPACPRKFGSSRSHTGFGTFRQPRISTVIGNNAFSNAMYLLDASTRTGDVKLDHLRSVADYPLAVAALSF
jgi:hypothetical protein